jgi:hypothetical protein
MAWIDDILLNDTKQLYPDSRAFKMPPGSDFELFHKALNKSEGRAVLDALSILNDIIPDNGDFGEDDATAWERRLGIISGGSVVPLDDRKAAILQKMAYPGTDAPRCAASYLQDQLQAAGFKVNVYENRFWDGAAWVTKTPHEVLGTTRADHGITLIANYIEESKDATFAIIPNYNSTFFIAGGDITDFVDVLATRKNEFRQLILQLKPQQECGFLFVNYI